MKPLNILVVEDNPIIGILLAEVLRDMGHDVCAIEASESGAIDAAARCKPDLMIVDVQLVEGSGIRAVEQISHWRQIPHVFVSGEMSSKKAFSPGAIVIQKPYREKDLVAAIERALGAPALT